jgi:hypothetical protein
MRLAFLDLLWPYAPTPARPVEHMDVVAELDDGSRWVSSFHDTHRFNRGVQGFRGLGPERPFRFGPRLVIVARLDEPTIRSTVEVLLETGHFEEAFERIDAPPAEG